MPKYVNPWADSPGFVALGGYEVITRTEVIHYDLYALFRAKGDGKEQLFDVSLGARSSDEGSDYMSGQLDFGWKYGGKKPLEEAARRFVTRILRQHGKEVCMK